ncbi:MAG: hypothetical protein LBQ83_05980, partial [Candidatus Margulisbacteria bacterium]|nr:hypothetical protein [Candidatus Margulisiibacteriota bacterium]
PPPPGNHASSATKTIILKEYPVQYTVNKNIDPYYPIINKTNTALYHKYASELAKFNNVYLCGRLAEYRYYNMDTIIINALTLANKIIKQGAKK